MNAVFLDKAPYALYAVVTCIGVYLMLSQRSLLKALMGLALVQSGIILFFVLIAVQREATVPILGASFRAERVHNPLPHAMMLTAIVVGIATLGVGVAILQRIHGEQGSIEDRDEGES